ncbi:MAG: hypothetical protein KAW17_09700 [Candidatus Eisenbacteria sp.]|nr:hypothetical protein [Candidatus Eisenbacteria bacterium]
MPTAAMGVGLSAFGMVGSGGLRLNAYTLALNRGDHSEFWTFYVNPQSITETYPSRTVIGHTLEGPFAEEYGRAAGTIQIAGNTGHSFRFGSSGLLNGAQQIQKIYSLYMDYQQSKEVTKAPKGQMLDPPNDDYVAFFMDWDKGLHHWVVIESLTIRKDVSRPLIFNYDLRLRVLGKMGEAEEISDPITGYWRSIDNVVRRVKDRLSGALGVIQQAATMWYLVTSVADTVDTLKTYAATLLGQMDDYEAGEVEFAEIDLEMFREMTKVSAEMYAVTHEWPERNDHLLRGLQDLSCAGNLMLDAAQNAREGGTPIKADPPADDEYLPFWDPALLRQRYPYYLNHYTQTGESLQQIAARYLGDADLWWLIAEVNGLDGDAVDPADIVGCRLKIPQRDLPASYADRLLILGPYGGDELYGTSIEIDVVNDFDFVVDSDGVIQILSGMDNFVQALHIVMEMARGELPHHPEFGTWIHDYIGRAKAGAHGGLTDAIVAAETIRAIGMDPRVQSVENPRIISRDDQLTVEVDVRPVNQPDSRVFGHDLPLGSV